MLRRTKEERKADLQLPPIKVPLGIRRARSRAFGGDFQANQNNEISRQISRLSKVDALVRCKLACRLWLFLLASGDNPEGQAFPAGEGFSGLGALLFATENGVSIVTIVTITSLGWVWFAHSSLR